MRRTIVTALLLAAPLLAHAGSVELRIVSPAIHETPPRSAVSVISSVRNMSAESFTGRVDVELPEGWRQLVADTPMTLGAQASVVRIISIFVPQEARAGDYPVRIAVVDTATGMSLAAQSLLVRVLPYLELTVDGLDGSTLVVAGEEIDLPFRVANRSNTSLAVSLELRSTTSFAGRIDGAPGNAVHLEPGESRRLVARIATPESIGRIMTYHVHVIAAGTTADGLGEVRSSFRASTQIIPAVSEEPAPLRTIPARLRLTSANTFDDGWTGSLRGELSGGGYLDSEARRRLAFLLSPSFRWPEPTNGNHRDVYRVSYEGPNLELLLGDHRYVVSPLLGASHYGRGVLARYALGAFRLAGLGFSPPGGSPAGSTIGALLDYSIPDSSLTDGYRYRAAANVLSRPGDDLRVSTRHEIRPDESTTLEAEAAVGGASGETAAWAAMVGATGTVSGIDLSGTARLAMPGYPGPMGDRVLVSGTASAPVGDAGFRLTARSSFEQQNLLRLDDLPSAARTVDAGLVAAIPHSNPAAGAVAGIRYRTRHDVLDDPAFDVRTVTILTSTRLTVGAVRLNVGTNHDFQRDELRDDRIFAHRYSLSGALTPTPGVSHSATLGLSARSGTAVPGTTTTSVGVSTSYRSGALSTIARASAAVSTNTRAVSHVTGVLSSFIDYRFPSAHVLSVTGSLRYAWAPAGGNVSGGLTVGYTLPLRVPVGKQRGVGGAEGMVYDSVTGEPAPNVVIRLADRAVVTGPAGRFQFSALSPGECYVQVDASRYGLGVIPDLPTPITSTVAADATTVLDIPVVRGATVTGVVRLHATRDGQEGLLQRALVAGNGEYGIDDLSPAGGLPRVVVELRNGIELRRVLTDRDGTFTFSDVRPGTWKVALAASQAPRFHRILESVFEVHLAPGSSEAVEFNVLPVRRPVTLLPAVSDPLTISVPERAAGPSEAPAAAPPVDRPDEPPAAVGPPPSGALLAMAIEHYAEPDPSAPRLLGLPWGTDEDGARAALGPRVTPFAAAADAPARPYVRALTTHGDLLLGPESTATLTFVDPLTDESELFLVAASVRTDARAGGLPDARVEAPDADAAFVNLIELWLARWRPARVDDEQDGDVRTVRAEVHGVLMTFRYERAKGIIFVDYQDLWHREAIRSVLADDGGNP